MDRSEGIGMLEGLLRYRRILTSVIQVALIILANYLAFLIRFDGVIPEPTLTLWRQMLPWLVVIRALTFIPFRLYEGLWRYTSIWDLCHILAGVLTSSLLFSILVYSGLGLRSYPRSVVLMDGVLLTCFLSIIRLGRRLY